MELTDADIEEFIDLWFQEFGERLSTNQARLQGLLLLQLYARLAEPLPRSDE